MTFFDEQGVPIQPDKWLKTYERYYFLDGPRNLRIRNQTSRFVEDQARALLTQTAPLSKNDLTLAMAWKIGEIDHRGSEAARQIKYLRNWPTVLKDRYGHDLSASISSLARKMPAILQQIAQGNPQYVFDLHPGLGGFGPTYILTILFFASHGTFPIYDRFAHAAALAINQNLPPGSPVKFRQVQKWSDCQQYMDLLSPIGKACPQVNPKNPLMFVSRPLDRALWVYGHFFQSAKVGPGATRPVRLRGGHPSASIPTSSNGVLLGRIRDLCLCASDGWRRREIIIGQDASGYPTVGDCIDLVDSSGTIYRDLPFIKGANVHGSVCLGKPGALKPWFTRHYPLDRVAPEKVYFEPTDRSSEYRIYSELEWKASSAKKPG